MAIALRPAVLLMLFASALFLVSGWLDGARPGAEARGPAVLGWISYFFGLVNLLVAVLIARGSERILALRIGLAGFFVLERPVTALAFGTRPGEAIAVHLLTALVELVILLTTLRVWRLGHSVSQADLSLLTAPLGSQGLTPALDTAAEASGPLPAAPAARRPPMAQRARPLIPVPTARVIALLALLLAGLLVADGLVSGVAPTAAAADTRALAYLYALVVLVVGLSAVSGRRLPLRLLYALAVVLFIERVFTVLAASGGVPLASVAAHAAAALAAVVLALACAVALRSTRRGLPAAQPA